VCLKMVGNQEKEVERDLVPCSVLVVGSSNTDYVLSGLNRLPQLGETVLVQGANVSFRTAAGGKSANAAVAASRFFAGEAQGSVSLITSVGEDENGRNALQNYEREGIFAALSKRSPSEASGIALILVLSSGENAILVAPGANANLRPMDFEATAVDGHGEARLAELRAASVVLMQLEIPYDTVRWVADALYAPPLPRQRPVLIVNLAPMGCELTEPMLQELFFYGPIIVVNEVECGQLLRILWANNTEALEETLETAAHDDWRTCLTGLMERAPALAAIILTRGAAGACAVHRFGMASGTGSTLQWIQVAAVLSVGSASVVDTTGAGDCFCGYLAAALAQILYRRSAHASRHAESATASRNLSLDDADFSRALRYATAAATLSVTRKGAQESYPVLQEVERFLRLWKD
jgi:ribokinase